MMTKHEDTAEQSDHLLLSDATMDNVLVDTPLHDNKHASSESFPVQVSHPLALPQQEAIEENSGSSFSKSNNNSYVREDRNLEPPSNVEQSDRLFLSDDTMESVILDTPLDDHKDTVSDSFPVQASHPLSWPRQEVVGENHRSSFRKNTNNINMRDDVFLDPPSYADVVFTAYAGDAGSNGSSKDLETKVPLSSSSQAVFSEYLTISVTQPQKVQDGTSSSLVPGSNTYVTYLIITHTNIPQYGGHDFSIRRRFRDVVTLADRLAESYRGYFVPARPEKNILESQVMQKQEFIEQRRVALEKYLRRLANHPVIRLSDELRLFLQSEGNWPSLPTMDRSSTMLDGALSFSRQFFGEGSVIVTPQEVVQPAKGGRELVRLFKELKQSVTIEWGGVKPAVNEEDKGFLERKKTLEEFEHHLREASQQAETLVNAQEEVGEAMGDLGLAFFKLAKFETEEAVQNSQRTHATDMRQLATAAVKASRFHREANAQAVKHLDQLHEYLSLMQSAHTAFSDRSNALLTVQTIMSEISSISTRIEKLTIASSKVFGGDKTRNRKIEELKEVLKTMDEARDCAMREYERIKGINGIELERLDCERRRDFLEMLKGFVHNQVGYAERVANVWSFLLENQPNPHHSGPFS